MFESIGIAVAAPFFPSEKKHMGKLQKVNRTYNHYIGV